MRSGTRLWSIAGELGIALVAVMSVPAAAVTVEYREGAVAPIAADVVVGDDVEDTDLRSGSPNAVSGGASWNLLANTFNQTIGFHLENGVPANSVVTSVTLTAYFRSDGGGSSGTFNGTQALNLHTLDGPWDETSVSWDNRVELAGTANDVPWTISPGGDIGALLSTALPTSTSGGTANGAAITWVSSPAFVAAANNAIANGGFLGMEVLNTSSVYAILWSSDEGSNVIDFRPILTVTFEPIPEPGSAALLCLTLGTLCARRRRP
jgi:hypothetical protein